MLNADETTRRPLKSNLTRNIPTATQTVKKQCSFATDDLNSDNRITKKISFDTTALQITINTNKPGMNVKRTKSFHNRFDLASPDEEKFINVTNTPEPALNRTNSQSSSVTSTSSSSTTSPISHSSSNSGIASIYQTNNNLKTRRKYSHGSALTASTHYNQPDATIISQFKSIDKISNSSSTSNNNNNNISNTPPPSDNCNKITSLTDKTATIKTTKNCKPV